MSKRARTTIYLVGSIATLAYSYLIAQVEYSDSREIFLIAPALLVAVITFARPLWGIFLLLLLSPLQTLGGEVLLLTRLLGIWVVAVTFARLLFVEKQRVRWTGVEGPIVLMILGMAMSLFRDSDTSRVFFSILSLISLYGFLLIIFLLIRNRDELETTLFVFLASGIYPIAQAIYQRLNPHPELTYARVEGTFTLSTTLGAFLIPIVLFALVFVFYSNLSWAKRSFVLGMFGVGVATLILTLSRGAIFGALLGGISIIVMLRSQLESRRITIGLITAIIVLTAWMFWPSVEGRVITPIIDYLNGSRSSSLVVGIKLRFDEIRVIIPAMLDTYLLGTGIGNYAELALRYRALYGLPDLPRVPHNILLYFFGEVGVVGAIGFVWLLLRLAQRVLFSYRSMISTTPNLIFYVYVGSVGSLLGYIVFMVAHSGFFQNEMWVVMAFFFTSIHLAKKTTDNPSPAPSRR